VSETQNVKLPTIAILGAGSMGRAILSGLVKPGVDVDGGIRVTNRSSARHAELFGDLPDVSAFATDSDPDANLTAVRDAAIVLVAVKPPMVPALLEAIAGSLKPGAVVVSVAAGVSIETFEALLPASVSVIRSMPNTPAIVGKAVTGISPGTRSAAADLQLVRTLFETVGEVIEVPESKLDALSTISGSGPAYVFYLIEELTRTAVSKGFTAEVAALLVTGTFAGATELLVQSRETPQELRRKVTSPNGTTERAIGVLETADLKGLFDRATDAALERALELAGLHRNPATPAP
jgi:pyrroline-5-carboxylate reductase